MHAKLDEGQKNTRRTLLCVEWYFLFATFIASSESEIVKKLNNFEHHYIRREKHTVRMRPTEMMFLHPNVETGILFFYLLKKDPQFRPGDRRRNPFNDTFLKSRVEILTITVTYTDIISFLGTNFKHA